MVVNEDCAILFYSNLQLMCYELTPKFCFVFWSLNSIPCYVGAKFLFCILLKPMLVGTTGAKVVTSPPWGSSNLTTSCAVNQTMSQLIQAQLRKCNQSDLPCTYRSRLSWAWLSAPILADLRRRTNHTLVDQPSPPPQDEAPSD
jgi:hypothetical protein